MQLLSSLLTWTPGFWPADWPSFELVVLALLLLLNVIFFIVAMAKSGKLNKSVKELLEEEQFRAELAERTQSKQQVVYLQPAATDRKEEE